ncbi:MAG: NAD(P)/FAD-dependent oxidoreductase [Gammaproteobacteria bacterium]
MSALANEQEAKGEASVLRVAILGSGPSGSALACMLARQGAEVTLFEHGRRPELVVGESLVPAVIPMLRRLGIENEIAAIGLLKPGASFVWSPTDRFSFTFARFAPAVPPYAYNVPRPRFDEVLLANAVASGARVVRTRARVERASRNTGTELRLAAETLTAASHLRGRQPDLIVDATGRSRLVARMLDIPTEVGPRDDLAHFAHFEGFRWEEAPGQVVISRLKAGWNWCIPLRDKLSIGIVVGRKDADRLGATPEERLKVAIALEPALTTLAGEARRVTPVATYSNYQLISQRGYGPGWVMLGDALGFVDPMLSPGVSLALLSAELLAEALTPLIRRRSPVELGSALARYTALQIANINAWSKLVAYFYDGRMAAMQRAGRDWVEAGPNFLKVAAHDHIERQVALQASGVGVTSRYSSGLLRFMGRYGLRGVVPADLAIQ